MPVVYRHLPCGGGRPDCRARRPTTLVAAAALGLIVVCGVPEARAGESASSGKTDSEQADSEQAEQTDSSESTSDDDAPDDDLQVETVAEPESNRTDPRVPSGWVTRVEPDHAFGRGRDLGDSLEQVEGVSVQRRSSLGQPTFATVRGGNPRQMSVYLNGIEIGAPAGVGFDVGQLSTGWIDAVDVYRGGAAAPYGTGALTGALELRARPPDEPGWATSATAMAGSFATRGFAARAATRSEEIGFELDANWRGSRGDFEFVDGQDQRHTRLNNDHAQLSLAGTAGVETETGRYHATLVHEDKSRGAPGPSEFQSAYRRARVDSRRTIAIADWERRRVASGAWGAIDARAAAGYVGRRLAYDNPDSYLSDRAVGSRSTHDAGALTAGLSGYLGFGDFFHLTLEGRTDHYRARHAFQSTSRVEADRQSVAVGASNELLAFDERLSLIAGLRAEIVDGRRGTSVPLVPSGGLVWRVADWLDVKANLARTHRLPDFDELYLRTETIRGNPELTPERALNLDAGIAVEPEGAPVGGAVTLFYNDIDEMILFLPQTAYLFEAENLGGAVARGLEASTRVTAGERYRARLSYTLTDAHLDASPAVQLPRHPRHRGGLSQRLELAGLGPFAPLHSLRLTTSLDARSALHLDNFGHLESPAFWQVDAGVSLAPMRALRIGLEVQNITDNRWGADQLQRPLPGRAVYASIEVSGGSDDREARP